MKSSPLSMVLFACICLSGYAKDFPAIKLENKVLKKIDGSSFLDGKQFGNMLKLRGELNTRLGKKKAQKDTDLYSFENQKYTLQQLTDFEAHLLASTSIEGQERLVALQNFLLDVKKDFVELTAPFLEHAKGGKPYMMELISEWAGKANRTSSHLLSWGASKEGQETVIIYDHIKNYEQLQQFFEDLVYFLESLMRSCEHAAQQFKDLLGQKQKDSAAPAV